MKLWRLARRFPRSKYFYVWNGYRYGSSGHFRLDLSLGAIARRARRYLRDGGREVVVDVRPIGDDIRTPDAATIKFSRWDDMSVELSQDAAR